MFRKPNQSSFFKTILLARTVAHNSGIGSDLPLPPCFPSVIEISLYSLPGAVFIVPFRVQGRFPRYRLLCFITKTVTAWCVILLAKFHTSDYIRGSGCVQSRSLFFPFIKTISTRHVNKLRIIQAQAASRCINNYPAPCLIK